MQMNRAVVLVSGYDRTEEEVPLPALVLASSSHMVASYVGMFLTFLTLV